MTRKRKLKRRVRERQARTGESYTTARRQVVERAAPAVPLVELVDITPQAIALGFRCEIAIASTLAARVEPAAVLARVRDELVRPHADVAVARMFGIAFGLPSPRLAVTAADAEVLQRFVDAARLGATGASSDGSLLALHVMGRDGLVPVICMVDDHAPLVLVEPADWTPTLREAAVRPRLFVSYHGRTYPVGSKQFTIGRGADVDLSLKDGAISRVHAAVIWRHGGFFLKDLGSTNGIQYKGMRIDNKRIEDGDVFVLGQHELRFTLAR